MWQKGNGIYVALQSITAWKWAVWAHQIALRKAMAAW